MITLRQLEALRFVIKYNTVTEASKMMHLSQPALSQLLSNLEYETGLTLFRRESRRLHPTTEAYLLSKHAEEIFSGLRQVEKISEQIRNKKTGILSLVSMLMLGREFLPGLIAEFLSDKPDVEANIGIEPQGAIRDIVAGRRCDIGYGFWGKPNPGITVVKSYRFPMVCVVPISDPLAEKVEITLGDFEGKNLICLSDGSRSQENQDRLFEQAGVRYLNHLSVQQTEIACEFVSKGCGVAIVNPFAAADYDRRGKLRMKTLNAPLDIEVNTYIPAGRKLSLVAQEFLEKTDIALQSFNNTLVGR